jgi:cephalosporin-C deacetylase
MPIVDMPLEKLKTYQGRNPKPADFDEFWDASLAELATIEPEVKFTPYDLPSNVAEFYEMRFKSTKGAKLYAKFIKPKNLIGKAPAVLVFHGLSTASSPWLDFVKYAAQGYVVAALDSRGQGGFSEDVGGVPGTTFSTPFMRGFDGDPSDLLCRDLFLDTAQLAKVVMGLDFVDETRVAVTGGSQGGGLAYACASLVPEIKLCAPIYPYLSDYQRVWEMDLTKNAYDGIRYYLRSYDPTHEHIEEFFTKLGYIDIQHLTPRIKAKVYMSTGLMDATCPPSTQFAAYNKVKSEKSVEIYPDFAHEMPNSNGEKVYNFICNNL